MAEYFRNLAAQTLGLRPRLEPMRPSRYQTAPEMVEVLEEVEKLEVAAPPSADTDQPTTPMTLPGAPVVGVAPPQADVPLVEMVKADRIATEVRRDPRQVTGDPLATDAREPARSPASEGPRRTATVTRSVVVAAPSQPGGRDSIAEDQTPLRDPDVPPWFAPPAESAPREIVVRIGRVDVRAITQPAAPAPPSASVRPRRPAPTLEDHLRKRGADLR